MSYKLSPEDKVIRRSSLQTLDVSPEKTQISIAKNIILFTDEKFLAEPDTSYKLQLDLAEELRSWREILHDITNFDAVSRIPTDNIFSTPKNISNLNFFEEFSVNYFTITVAACSNSIPLIWASSARDEAITASSSCNTPLTTSCTSTCIAYGQKHTNVPNPIVKSRIKRRKIMGPEQFEDIDVTHKGKGVITEWLSVQQQRKVVLSFVSKPIISASQFSPIVLGGIKDCNECFQVFFSEKENDNIDIVRRANFPMEERIAHANYFERGFCRGIKLVDKEFNWVSINRLGFKQI